MKKRENLIWQIILVIGLIAILFNGYKLYNMNNDVISLWETFEKAEIGTDKKLTGMVQRLEINLDERVNSEFDVQAEDNPSNLETVHQFGDRESQGSKHFLIQFCGKHPKKGEYCRIKLRDRDDLPQIYAGDEIAGGVIKKINRKENFVIFEKNGETFKIEKKKL